MFKLSKESKLTFLGLLFVPLVWIGVNSLGYLDYLKTKTLDWRLEFRGEVSLRDAPNADDQVPVEGNLTVPRIPNVTYVNFDAKTLAMDGVGERPWDRAFFRDVAKVLLERGNARVVAFDFLFSPKSASKMVPSENVHRSDGAVGELVATYSDRIVLGSGYTGVQTSLMRVPGAQANPPFLKDGYNHDEALAAGKIPYPEAPTYPMLSFRDGKYLGRHGSITVIPYREVDNVPRWVPLWFPAGGKAHAYNVLGGKRQKLSLDIQFQESAQLSELEAQLTSLGAKEKDLRERLAERDVSHRELSSKKIALEEELAQLRIRLDEALEGGSSKPAAEADSAEIKKLKDRLAELDEAIGNFKNTLKANPALAAVVEPQLKAREKERGELAAKLVDLEGGSGKPDDEVDPAEVDQELVDRLKAETIKVEGALADLEKELNSSAEALDGVKNELEGLVPLLAKQRNRLRQLQGEAKTELVEVGDRLRLVYHREDGDMNGTLVDSFPNEMPLIRDRRQYTLGVETLLAYYGIDDDSVKIDEAGKRLKILGMDGLELVDAPMEDGQFVEVNWFSKWGEPIKEVEDLREARVLYGDEDFDAYVSLAPEIIRGFLGRVKDFEVPTADSDLPDALLKLGVEEEHVRTAREFVQIANGETESSLAPEFSRLLSLTGAIDYYFLPVGLSSPYNPMCGMKDVMQFDRYLSQRSGDLDNIDAMIAKIQGEFLPKIEKVLEENPEHEQALAKMEEINAALSSNRGEREKVVRELALINEFFGKFENAIVFIGPEEKTFQDLAPTPLDAIDTPKVGVHGNIVKTLTSGIYLKRLPSWMDHAATFGFCILLAFIAVYQGPKSQWVQLGAFVVQLGYVFIAFSVFSETHVLWPVATPTCAGLSTSLFGLGAMVVIEQKAKGRLKGMFGSYVSSDLVEQMVESGEEPSLGGEETSITAYFSDVQAFSSFSELLSPTGLVDLMNEYLTAMTNILQEERGTLDKYIGDAIVAMYGAPIPMEDHAYQSVKTAILMQHKQIELREKWKSEGDKWPDIVAKMQTRIGCNTGTATVGNMGALDRFNYTMMGDMVNLAARCESGAKAYGAYIMITEETKLAAEAMRDDIAYRYLDKIVVKGRTQPVAMYEPTGFMSELTQETQDCLDCFRQGIDKYLGQDWDGALKMFEKAKEMEPNKPGVTPGVQDNPSMILIDRCQVMKDNPPGDDWDGVYVMTTK